MHILNQRLEPAPGVLYVVGTPIGNLGDLSPRAKSVLAKASVIASEDTRHSGKLLKSLGSTGKQISFHQHNYQSRIPKLLDILKEGKTLAVISDAGLPGISDPGEELVAAARKALYEVICVPGPCAAITALVSSGLPSTKFCFEGFLPSKGNERKLRLASIAKERRTTIIYEAPHRLIKLMKELEELCGGSRRVQVAKELTKLHEEQIGPDISTVLDYFLEHKPKGEITIILDGKEDAKENQINDIFWEKELNNLIAEGESPSQAVRKLAKKTGLSRSMLYSLIHKKTKVNYSKETN